MNPQLSASQIEATFPDEWVLVVDPAISPLNEILAGRVVFHSAHRDEVYQEAVRLKPPSFSVLFTGKLPKDMAVVL